MNKLIGIINLEYNCSLVVNANGRNKKPKRNKYRRTIFRLSLAYGKLLPIKKTNGINENGTELNIKDFQSQ